MIRLSQEDFEEMVVRCYEELPEGLLEYLENLDIVVEEWPSEEELGETGAGGAGRFTWHVHGSFAAG